MDNHLAHARAAVRATTGALTAEQIARGFPGRWSIGEILEHLLLGFEANAAGLEKALAKGIPLGFCFFNNVAVGAAHALAAHGLERVAIVDFDVHHGNGTEHIFETEPRVLFCSSFQHPFYPFTGHETDTPHIVNITLPAGSDGARFRDEVERNWLHRLHEFQPQLVLISAGFDAHAEDDMSHVRLREPDYIWITRELKKVADQYASGRIVSTLEGGYNLSALDRSAVAHLDALLGH